MIKVVDGEVVGTGLYKMSDSDYFSRPEMSNSDISKFLESPKAYKYYKSFGGMAQTESMLIGSIVHCLYLEPELFESTFCVAPEIDRRTKAGKAEWARFVESSQGKKPVAQEILDEAGRVVLGLRSTLGDIKEIAGEGYAELTGIFEHRDVKCRMKIDYITEDGFIWDLKTTKSLKSFSNSIANYGYHRQVAMYYLGVQKIVGKCKGFKFIAVENNAPYDAAVFKLDMEGYKLGLKEIEFALNRYKICYESNVWPGAFESEVEMSLPKWYRGSCE